MFGKVLAGILLAAGSLMLFSCGQGKAGKDQGQSDTLSAMQQNLAKYVTVRLESDISHLTDDQKQMLRYLFEAADLMDAVYWKQSYGDKDVLLQGITDSLTREFVLINYGPWDRLNGNAPFVEGIGAKPLGAAFYPADMTREEFEAWDHELKSSQYTMVRRNSSGALEAVWYHEAFASETQKAADLLRKAAALSDEPGLKKYLELRAEALLTDEYRASDFAWLNMKDNLIDMVIGPIENYEDELFNIRAAHEAFILLKDVEWSRRLARFAQFLPQFQKNLPVAEKYRNEMPGTDGSELNAYDVVYYAGDCNSGSKTIAINLPNDEVVRSEKGSRKLQLKNAMRAKFEKILVPISDVLIAEDQRQHVTFDAFFANTMYHEVAHGLGLGYLSDNKKVTVREALQETYTSIEEGKADILGLFIVDQLHGMGELGDVDIKDYYTTFMASIFRSIRFGVSSAHGKANMMRFYFFQERGAFVRDAATGTYRIDYDKMKVAMNELTTRILTVQGDGDYAAAKAWIEADGAVRTELQQDLDRLMQVNIPVDVVYEQGPSVLGL
ncbi:MAG TPA: Zn-dependent hydrolase [Bacteroidales bacterium]|nr:Zn-dependent hydrolase [Bacteroidales bacterium]